MSNETSGSTTPPGWYPDPSGKPGQTYWDGRQWVTDSTASGAASPPLGKGGGLSRNGKILIAVGAGLVAVVGIAVIIAVATGSGGIGQSRAYQDGYEFGINNAPLIGEGPAGYNSGEILCGGTASAATGFSGSDSQEAKDWERGCLDGFAKALDK